jgi:hypothetical protein
MAVPAPVVSDQAAAAPWLSEAAIVTANRILRSHALAFGTPLIAPLPADATPEQWAQALFAAERVVLAHDGADPAGDPGPRLIYANREALKLWRRSWADLVGMPSRLTAEPGARQERAQALLRVQSQQAIANYGGIRIDSQGRRFRIDRAKVFSLRNEAGEPCGQAACFARWYWI